MQREIKKFVKNSDFIESADKIILEEDKAKELRARNKLFTNALKNPTLYLIKSQTPIMIAAAMTLYFAYRITQPYNYILIVPVICLTLSSLVNDFILIKSLYKFRKKHPELTEQLIMEEIQ